MRELNFEEIAMVSGGDGTDAPSVEPVRGDALQAAGCMTSLAMMGVAVVAGITGPLAIAGFVASAVSALSSCSSTSGCSESQACT